jgi:hypothetical protein
MKSAAIATLTTKIISLSFGAASLVACGSTLADPMPATPPNSPTEAGTPEVADAASRVDAGPQATTDAAVDAPPAKPTRSGFIAFEQDVRDGQMQGSIGMLFSDRPSYGLDEVARAANGGNCEITQFGACGVVRCLASSSPPLPPEVRASAGSVVARGGALPLTGATFTDTTDAGSYSTRSGAFGRLFAGGDKLTVNAAGAANGVPAFTTEITAPSDLTGIAPNLRAGVDASVTHDFTVTWNRGGAGDAMLNATFFVAEPASVSTQIICIVPQTAGSATMPKEALAKVPANAFGAVFLSPTTTKFQNIGDFRLRVSARGEVVSGKMTVR